VLDHIFICTITIVNANNSRGFNEFSEPVLDPEAIKSRLIALPSTISNLFSSKDKGGISGSVNGEPPGEPTASPRSQVLAAHDTDQVKYSVYYINDNFNSFIRTK
jgi:hypothetical protein